MASESDDTPVLDLLAAIAPIVGSPRIVAATGNIVKALGLAIELAESE